MGWGLECLPMLRTFLLMLISVGLAHAEPAKQQPDDLDSLLTQSGWVAQFSHMGHSVGSQASELVVNAMGYIGVPYKRGGSNENGFDCSGFVRAMYQKTMGLVLPHNARAQAAVTDIIDRAELQPGDLVFYNTLRKTFSHVGIYIGEGKFIHSPRSGGEVRIENMSDAYWVKRFNGARRVATVQTAPAAVAHTR